MPYSVYTGRASKTLQRCKSVAGMLESKIGSRLQSANSLQKLQLITVLPDQHRFVDHTLSLLVVSEDQTDNRVTIEVHLFDSVL